MSSGGVAEMEQEDPELTSSHLHSTTAPFQSNHLGEQPEDEQGKKKSASKDTKEKRQGLPVVKILCFQCRGCGFNPRSGNWEHAIWDGQKLILKRIGRKKSQPNE